MIQFLIMYEGECYSQSHWHIFADFFLVGDIDTVEPSSLSASHIPNVTIVTHENRPNKKETDNISTIALPAIQPSNIHAIVWSCSFVGAKWKTLAAVSISGASY